LMVSLFIAAGVFFVASEIIMGIIFLVIAFIISIRM
jgi:hypothetical protein